MDSMKRSEASSSHHQNKVVSTNQATDSNSKQVNLSGSTLNNNTVSNKQQQNHQNPSQTPAATASACDITKDSNFEYDDNEWDVGIGDLIIDLDADIEKSSVGNQQPSNQLSCAGGSSSASTQSLTSLSPQTPEGDKNTGLRKSDSISSSSQNSSEPAGGKSVKGKLPPANAKHTSSPVTLTTAGTTSTSSSKQHSSTCSYSSSSSLFTPGQQFHHHHHKASSNTSSKHSVLLNQLNSKHTSLSSLLSSSGVSTLNQNYSSSGSSCSSSSSTDFGSSKDSKERSSTTMSSTTSSSGGKSATKLAVDHQATLDKGLKMKIKRTKPGTKTSEAKHEIVKAEQNGSSSLSSSNVEEANNSSNSISSNKKHSSQSQSQAQQQVISPNISQQQGTKRGSSGHRRDKTKEKTTHHNQRDKNEHNNISSGSGSSTATSTITSSSGDRCCNCTHDIQVNGVQQPCSSASCIRSRTTDPSIASMTQRLSNQNNSSTSTSSSFASSSNTGPSISSSNTPGPPSSKDNAKHSTSSVGSNNGGGSSGSNSTASNSSSCSGTSASSSNNVLKSQLQSSIPPTSLINALSSVSAAGSSVASTSTSTSTTAGVSAGGPSSSSATESSSALSREDKGNSPPPAKRHKCDPKDMVDVCVGTSVGTITEPDCLGPCEPGTSVTLEGIVWHETEGGVLVVNVTWRGKTYVGTLIDCTKHDWAPPRFCDSPTEEFDSRTPKGRGKRGRNSTLFPVNDLSNFTETRSSMHSKLRNGGTKGRGGRGTSTTAENSSSKTVTTSSTTTANASSTSSTSTSMSSNTPSTSPVAFLPPRPEKRKSKDEPPSPLNGGGNAGGAAGGTSSSNSSGGTSIAGSSSVGTTAAINASSNGTGNTQSGVAVNPMTGLNVQISTKKCKSSSSPCAISPVLLECPEQDCSKKYKHANGLRYHQSHAHGSISSMDEDSSQPPEPPTTPSPLPTVQLVNFPAAATPTTTSATSPSSTNSTALTSTAPSIFSSVSSSVSLPTASSVAVTQSNSNINTATTTSTTTTTTSSGSTMTGPSSLLMVANVSTAATNSPTTTTTTITSPHSSMASVPVSTVTTQPTSTTSATSQHTVTSLAAAGGSITTGVAGSLVPQMQLGPGGNSTLLSTALAGAQNGSGLIAAQPPSQSQPASQQSSSASPQVNTVGGIGTASTPNKSKPGVLRFGPLPQIGNNESDHTQRLMSSGVTSPPGGGISNSMTLSSALQPAAAASGNPEAINPKAQNCSKQKKNRKSPGPSEFDVAASSRAEDVQSPAYSDISDDSTPVVDTGDLDKSKGPQPQDVSKKSSEAVPGPLGPLSGYGIYPYYPGMQHQSSYYSTEHSAKPPGLGHSPLGPNAGASVDYKSNKEPPLDLMNKPIQQQPPPPQPGQPLHSQQMAPGDLPSAQPGKDGPIGPPSSHPGAGKMMQHFYPYGYMPTGFGYNLDPTYGPVAMMSEENKHTLQQQPSGQIKEERIKESPSPSEYTKLGPQMVPTKVIKSEPVPVKDIKTESGHSLHPKDQPPPGQQPGQQPISAYGGMFRHGLNVGPQAQHLNREEELRRLFNYSDQRRSSTTNSSSTANLNTKEEPSSPSQVPPGHPNHGPVHGPPSSQGAPNTSQQQSQQHKGSKSSSTQQQLKQPKDIKSEDKETLKVKQEGQKPTMETQGPPPPPTSQYYPHSLYMSAAPFGFDPNHQMYRNMLVPAASYSAPPYHLQIPRYTSPEDLSRNPSTKALDLLQHHASQYYNSHKIHELREGALKSPTSNVKVSVSSPNLSQQSSQNPNMCIPPSNSSISSSGLSLQQQQQQQQQQQAPPSTHSQQQPPGPLLQPSQAGGPNAGSNPGSSGVGIPDQQKDPGGSAGTLGPGPAIPGGPPQQPGQPPGSTRSPPPQRHVHTHHHTHVGLGYPMFQAPYGAAVLASQQAAAAVTVISPFQTGPPAK